jgi:hypothetical protein
MCRKEGTDDSKLIRLPSCDENNNHATYLTSLGWLNFLKA